MAHKQQQLLELLKEDQEPFHLQSYIANRRSQFKNPKTSIQLKKHRPIIPETSIKRSTLCKHACFLSFQNSPDVRKSPFIDFNSPAALSPCKSPNAAVFLHIPSKTAAFLAEAAMRIQKQQQAKSSKNVGFGLFGSFLKKLKDRSKNKRRPIENQEVTISRNDEKKLHERIEEENVTDLNRASTSSSCSECSEMNSDFDFEESRFCTSPFRFSLHNSPSPTGLRTPELCSPVVSPGRHLKQDKDNSEVRDSNDVQGEEDKEQCSPVSVLDPSFEDEHESEELEDDYGLESSYANVLRAKQQLLDRLRRFEKLAELDPMELERNFLEGSDSDLDQGEREESENDEPLSLHRNHHTVETIVASAFNQPIVQCFPKKLSTDRKRLISDLIEEKSDVRIRNKFDLRKEVEFDTIDMMLELDLNKDADAWRKFSEEGDETLAEIELDVFCWLVEELSEELFYMNAQVSKDLDCQVLE